MIGIKKVSRIDRNSKKFIGYYYVNVVNGEMQLGEDCVDSFPPEFGEFESAIFINGTWNIVPNYSNCEVYSKTSGERIIKILGEGLTQDETIIKPLSIDYSIKPRYVKVKWDENLNNWVEYNDETEAFKIFNSIRSGKLFETDWLILRHNDELVQNIQPTLSNEQYHALLNYRQALRDMPEQPGFDVFNPQWPVKPF